MTIQSINIAAKNELNDDDLNAVVGGTAREVAVAVAANAAGGAAGVAGAVAGYLAYQAMWYLAW
jgi:bacteriocin-like protein